MEFPVCDMVYDEGPSMTFNDTTGFNGACDILKMYMGYDCWGMRIVYKNEETVIFNNYGKDIGNFTSKDLEYQMRRSYLLQDNNLRDFLHQYFYWATEPSNIQLYMFAQNSWMMQMDIFPHSTSYISSFMSDGFFRTSNQEDSREEHSK